MLQCLQNVKQLITLTCYIRLVRLTDPAGLKQADGRFGWGGHCLAATLQEAKHCGNQEERKCMHVQTSQGEK